jgi:hypothetical protein
VDDLATSALMQTWSGSQRVATASYFFWINGNQMQRSQERDKVVQDAFRGPRVQLSTRLLKRADREVDKKQAAQNQCQNIEGLERPSPRRKCRRQERRTFHRGVVNLIQYYKRLIV